MKTKSTGARNVLLRTTITSIHGVTQDDVKKKPAIYKLYDFTKGGTDIVDQRAEVLHIMQSQPNWWTLVGFCYILDWI